MNSSRGSEAVPSPAPDQPEEERDWQRALYIPLTILAWLAVVVIGAWLMGHVVKTILTLVLSGIVAFALTPLVTLLTRFMPRGIAIAVAYILGFAVIIGLGVVLVLTASSQVSSLAHTLPAYINQAQGSHQDQITRLLKPLQKFGLTASKIHTAEHQATSYVQGIATAAAKDSLNIISTVLGTLIDIILVLILSIYLTANGPRIAQRMRQETPVGQRRHINLLIAIVNQVVGGYVRGTLTLALLIGALVGIGMYALHVRYAVLLGVLAFFMEFIPIVGVLVSGTVCVVIALFQGWVLALFVLGYFVVVHVIEGDVVGPRIMGQAVGIHPATALVALVAGTELFGFWGALFGAPLAGLLQAIGTAAYRELRGGDPTAVVHAMVEGVKDNLDAPEPQEVSDAPASTELSKPSSR